MKGIMIGLICLCFGLFLFFVSPKEKKNMFGYKSLQQGMHREIWKWTNQCFGLFIMVGSIVYLAFSIAYGANGISFFTKLNRYGLFYIVISFVLTEAYGLIRRHGAKN